MHRVALAILAALASSYVYAQTAPAYPIKPVRIVIQAAVT